MSRLPFRGVGRRLRTTKWLAAAWVALGTFAAAPPILGAPSATAPPAAAPTGAERLERARGELRALRQGGELGKTEVQLVWRRRPDPEAEARPSENDPPVVDWAVLGEWIGRVLTYAAALFGVAALAALALSIRRHARGGPGRPGGSKAGAAPATLFGLDLRPESLPADVGAAARASWEVGDWRGALSLLYRGALRVVTTAGRVAVPASATELECVELVARDVGGQVATDFADLTDTWRRVAYGGIAPSDDLFRGLLFRWEVHLAGSRSWNAEEPRP